MFAHFSHLHRYFLILSAFSDFSAALLFRSSLSETPAGDLIFSSSGIIIRRPELSTLPALRGYRLLKYFPTLHGMLLSAVSSIQAIANVVVFFCIVGFCFLVSGRYIFGSKMDAITRSNFGSLGNGAITLLQLISGDSWSGVMYASMQAFPNNDYLSQFSGCLLVILWLIFANLVVKNLFVAVILENFSITDTIATITKKGELGVVRNAFRNSYTAAHKRIAALSAGSVDLDVHTGMLSVSNLSKLP